MDTLNYTPEQLEAAKNAKTPEELAVKAKEAGIGVTLEQAARFLNQAKAGELADEELENVAGGGCGVKGPPCPKCGSTDTDWLGEQDFACGSCDFHWTGDPERYKK